MSSLRPRQTVRQRAEPPWRARLSGRRFTRWAAKTTGSERLASFGERSILCPPAMIIGHHRIHIGSDVVIHPGSFFSVVEEDSGKGYDGRLVIGDRVVIGSGLVIACCGRIEIGERVGIADRVYIGDTYHEYRDVSKPILDQGLHDPRPVSIGRGAFIGVGSAVLPGVSVGAGACVGANSVVAEDVPPHTLAIGNPARVIRRWDGTAWRSTARA
ncbi:MAG: acyltransferase [Solirubrobacteraceae bacterium]